MNTEIKTLQLKVIEGSLLCFNADLQAALDDGWKILGDLHVSLVSSGSYSRIDYSQQVAKYPENSAQQVAKYPENSALNAPGGW